MTAILAALAGLLFVGLLLLMAHAILRKRAQWRTVTDAERRDFERTLRDYVRTVAEPKIAALSAIDEPGFDARRVKRKP